MYYGLVNLTLGALVRKLNFHAVTNNILLVSLFLGDWRRRSLALTRGISNLAA